MPGYFTNKILYHLIQKFLYNNPKKLFLIVFWYLTSLKTTHHVSLVEIYCWSKSVTTGSPSGFPNLLSKQYFQLRCVWPTLDCFLCRVISVLSLFFCSVFSPCAFTYVCAHMQHLIHLLGFINWARYHWCTFIPACH